MNELLALFLLKTQQTKRPLKNPTQNKTIQHGNALGLGVGLWQS